MRMPRPIINEDEYGNYHLISRIIDSSFYLTDEEKSTFEKTMLKLSRFSGIDILSFSVMSNHFHILVRVPPINGEIDEATLVSRYRVLYGSRKTDDLLKKWKDWTKKGMMEEIAAEQNALRKRMHNISPFMKEVKQSFTKYYNKLHSRKGTLWEERFKSVIVENDELSLTATAAYIDLNSVRAGIKDDPRKYKWSSIAHAYKGDERFQSSIAYIMQMDNKEEALKKYCGLIAQEGIRKRENKCVMGDEAYEKLMSYSQIEYREMSMLRIGAMTRGCFFGSRSFVNDMFKRFKKYFSTTRTTGARKIPCTIDGEKLYTVRALRKSPIEISHHIS